MLAGMGRSRTIVRLRDLAPGQQGDFFALLTEKTRGRTVQGKAYYHCRFRDGARLVTYMAWAEGPWFDACERDWHAGQFYKIRATYSEHERYGAQLEELLNIRAVQDS